jgi:hypothetical protein
MIKTWHHLSVRSSTIWHHRNLPKSQRLQLAHTTPHPAAERHSDWFRNKLHEKINRVYNYACKYSCVKDWFIPGSPYNAMKL